MEQMKYFLGSEKDDITLHLLAPFRMQGHLNKYVKIMRGIPSKSKTGNTKAGIRYKEIGRDTEYTISTRNIGQSASRASDLLRTMRLISTAQKIARNYDMLDPLVHLNPAAPDAPGQVKKYPLGAAIAWDLTSDLHFNAIREASAEKMRRVHQHLVDPQGSGALSFRSIGVIANRRDGFQMRLGNPAFTPAPEVFRAVGVDWEASMLEMYGEPSSHEHALIFMVGAVAASEVLAASQT